MDPRPRAAVVTISDGVTHGTREDASGDLASELVAAAGFEVAERVVIPDERDRIEDAIRTLAVAVCAWPGLAHRLGQSRASRSNTARWPPA